MQIRNYQPIDCKQITQLFYDTVHHINAKDYTKEQLGVWATGKVDYLRWNELFLQHHTIVAQKNNQIIGFGDIQGGYIDHLYVHKNNQNQGVATAILHILEQRARSSAQIKTTTHASITARPFFEKRGYSVIKEQWVERGGIQLTNFVMEKQLI